MPTNENCLFYNFENNPDNLPEPMNSILSTTMEEPMSPEETAEAIAAMEAPACPNQQTCRVSVGALLRYVMAAGDAERRQELDALAAPDCMILDIPHDIDRQLGPFLEPPDNRLE